MRAHFCTHPANGVLIFRAADGSSSGKYPKLQVTQTTLRCKHKVEAESTGTPQRLGASYFGLMSPMFIYLPVWTRRGCPWQVASVDITGSQSEAFSGAG